MFEHASDFLRLHAQQPYRLIISDRGLDDTFDKLLLTLRNRNDSTPVIAHTAGMSYGPHVLYDKGYSAFFPIAEITPEALQFMLKKYLYYAEKGVLPALGK